MWGFETFHIYFFFVLNGKYVGILRIENGDKAAEMKILAEYSFGFEIIILFSENKIQFLIKETYFQWNGMQNLSLKLEFIISFPFFVFIMDQVEFLGLF